MTDKFYSKPAADYVGLAYSTWRSYATNGRRPEPDGQEDGGRPYWNRATLDEYRAALDAASRRASAATNYARLTPGLIAGLAAWLTDPDGGLNTERFDQFEAACTVGPDREGAPTTDDFVALGVTATSWAVRTGNQHAGELATHGWTTATWQEITQLFFAVIAATTAARNGGKP